MRNFGKLAAASAFGMIGTGAAMLPAAASTLAVNFTAAPTALVVSKASPGEQVYAYGYQFTATANESVTALGTYDNGALNNLGNDNSSPPGGGFPTAGSSPDHPGDIVALYAGTIPNAGNPGGSLNNLTPIASVVVGGTSGGTQVGAYWAFQNLGSSVNLTAGSSYFIVTIYDLVNYEPVATFPTEQATFNGIILNSEVAENCSAPDNCVMVTADNPGVFGPNFETTPLPATLPLFAGGLGLMGFLGRRKQRKAAATAAA
jgi:hypothetical protein